MLKPIFCRCWCVAVAFLAAFFLTAQSLWAQAPELEPAKEPEWVISYSLMILFLGLTLAILLRPTKRSDSAFTYDEQKAIKEEEMKKIKGKH